MTREEAKEIKETFDALNVNRDALKGIIIDELMLYTTVKGKPVCITQLLTDDQYIEIEAWVSGIIRDNIRHCERYLYDKGITNMMLKGR